MGAVLLVIVIEGESIEQGVLPEVLSIVRTLEEHTIVTEEDLWGTSWTDSKKNYSTTGKDFIQVPPNEPNKEKRRCLHVLIIQCDVVMLPMS